MEPTVVEIIQRPAARAVESFRVHKGDQSRTRAHKAKEGGNQGRWEKKGKAEERGGELLKRTEARLGCLTLGGMMSALGPWAVPMELPLQPQ